MANVSFLISTKNYLIAADFEGVIYPSEVPITSVPKQGRQRGTAPEYNDTAYGGGSDAIIKKMGGLPYIITYLRTGKGRKAI